MAVGFDEIPSVVIDFIREKFCLANDKATRALCVHPSMHEETLDHLLVMELAASPPAFFAKEQMGVAIETHWLGGRWMFERWEVADIAIFIILRKNGHLQSRKVALLQTKRLYSKEIAVAELGESDYIIGIGRLADKVEPIVPLSRIRAFTFNENSIYGAIQAGEDQIERIRKYVSRRGIPVYYGLYNPLTLPYSAAYPASNGKSPTASNEFGLRVLPFESVAETLRELKERTSPSIENIKLDRPIDECDKYSELGWKIENFVADEVLRCRQGKIFDPKEDENLNALLYGRSAPISAAISITIDFGPGKD